MREDTNLVVDVDGRSAILTNKETGVSVEVSIGNCFVKQPAKRFLTLVKTSQPFQKYTAPQEIYKDFTRVVGVTPSVAQKVIQSAVWNKFFSDPILVDCLRRYGYSGGGRNNNKILAIIEMKDVILRTYQDGNKHLVPLMVKFKKSPEELKKKFGKSSWKKIHHSSEYKIRTMVNSLPSRDTWQVAKIYSGLTPVEVKKHCVMFGGRWRDDTTEAVEYVENEIIRNTKIPLGAVHEKVDMILDTIRLIYLCGDKAPRGESLIRELNHLHDEYTGKYRNLKNLRQSVPFNLPEKVVSIGLDLLTEGGVVARALKSAKEYKEEGDSMHHCIYYYWERAAKQDYLAYHLENKDAGTKSSLGFNVNKGVFTKNQHYGACNAIVTDVKLLEMEAYLLRQLNKE